jgi:hypothetical protein
MKKLVFLIALVLVVLAIRDKYSSPRDRSRSHSNSSGWGVKPKTYRVTQNDVRWFGGGGGKGELTVTNNRDYAAYIKLLSHPARQKVCAGLILAKESYTIPGVPDGTYFLEYALGDEIVTGTEKLWDPVECVRFTEPVVFATQKVVASEPFGKRSVKTTTSVQHTILTVTLLPVGGNTKGVPISAEVFDGD